MIQNKLFDITEVIISSAVDPQPRGMEDQQTNSLWRDIIISNAVDPQSTEIHEDRRPASRENRNDDSSSQATAGWDVKQNPKG
jgi:hypothetical protein